jgi:hypothetical protein
MDKKYQIFVSSTFVDLKEERQAVLTAVQEAEYIPSGMEMFPATDEEQFNFIKRIIDNCDYYVVIIAGRYGSLAPDGISYTEKEYDYAVNKGIRVLAFVRNENEIDDANKDTDPAQIQRLAQFKAKVQTGRLVRPWNNKHDLVSSVIISLNKEKSEHPAIGWVRANQVMSNENLVELSQLRKEVAELREYKRKLEERKTHNDIAGVDEKIRIRGTKTHIWRQEMTSQNWECEVTWKQLFMSIAPYLLECPNDQRVESLLKNIAYSYTGEHTSDTIYINNQDFQKIKIQFMALGLVTVSYMQTTKGGMALFWNLTEGGKQLMMQWRTIKTTKTNNNPFKKS